MTAIEQGYRKFQSAIRDAGLSQAGATWLQKAVDPFCDVDIPITGYPDQVASKTIVQEIKKSIDVSFTSVAGAPGALTSYDLQIDFLPIMSALRMYNAAFEADTGTVKGDAAMTENDAGFVWPLNINVLSGTKQSWPDPVANGSVPLINVNGRTGLDMGPQFMAQGPVRVIAAGFEVINTTPEIYVGGSAITYRQPILGNTTPFSVHFVDIVGDSQPAPVNNVQLLTIPPASADEIMLLPGSLQWHAKEGAYVVATFEEDNPFVNLMQTKRTLWTGYMAGVDKNTATTGSVRTLIDSNWFYDMLNPAIPLYPASYCEYAVASAGVIPFGPTPFVGPALISQMHACGAFFQNVPINSTFTINVHWVIERIPNYNSDLITMAEISAPYDRRALELYVETSLRMPTGCMVKYNPLGEWFNTIMGLVSKVAPMVGGAFGPEGMAIGDAVGVAAGALGRLNKKPRR